jgi:hypothetical protein
MTSTGTDGGRKIKRRAAAIFAIRRAARSRMQPLGYSRRRPLRGKPAAGSNSLRFFVALECRQPALVDFGDARQSADVFTILTGEFLQILDFTMSQFQIHRECFDAFVYGQVALPRLISVFILP